MIMYMELWKKIPPDIMINNIMPFTYKTINKNLLFDIRTFVRDYRTIINYYYFDMNEYILLNDLIWFCNNQSIHGVIYNDANYPYIKIMNILDRNPMFSRLSNDRKFKYIKNNYYYNIMKNTHSKIFRILSLFTQIEREKFMHCCIIDID